MKAATLSVPVAEVISIWLNTSVFPIAVRCAGIVIAVLEDVDL